MKPIRSIFFTVVEAGDHHITIIDGDRFEPLWRCPTPFALLSVWEDDGAIVVYDAATLEEVKRIPMRKPVGKSMSITRLPTAREPATRSRPRGGAARGTSYPQARVLLVGHGSERCPAAFRVIERHADALQRRNPLYRVHAAALFGEGSLLRGLSGLRGEPVFIVPMFMCDGLTVRNVLPQALREATDALSTDDGVDHRMHLCEPIGLSPAIADLAAKKTLAAAANWSIEPAHLDVLLCAHGSRQNPASERGANLQAGRLRAKGLFRQVEAVFLEQEPHLTEVLARDCGPIVVVGLFSGGSRHATLDIGEAVAARNHPHLSYLGAVGDDDDLVDIIEAAIENRI